jgi:hypothetical protein
LPVAESVTIAATVGGLLVVCPQAVVSESNASNSKDV